MKRILAIVLLLYLIVVAVDVTAANARVTPVTPRWAILIAERVVSDVRWAFQRLAEWRNTWLDQTESSAQVQPIQPAPVKASGQ